MSRVLKDADGDLWLVMENKDHTLIDSAHYGFPDRLCRLDEVMRSGHEYRAVEEDYGPLTYELPMEFLE